MGVVSQEECFLKRNICIKRGGYYTTLSLCHLDKQRMAAGFLSALVLGHGSGNANINRRMAPRFICAYLQQRFQPVLFERDASKEQ